MRVMFHDDDCGALLDAEGRCPDCRLSPDARSTGFLELSQATVDRMISAGRTLLGMGREPIRRTP